MYGLYKGGRSPV